jgi:hypothetical protein
LELFHKVPFDHVAWDFFFKKEKKRKKKNGEFSPQIKVLKKNCAAVTPE